MKTIAPSRYHCTNSIGVGQGQNSAMQPFQSCLTNTFFCGNMYFTQSVLKIAHGVIKSLHFHNVYILWEWLRIEGPQANK